jgi:outer membrane murein-binding lipoprotein Lpp
MTGVRRLLLLGAGIIAMVLVTGCSNTQNATSFTKPATTSATQSGVQAQLIVQQTAQVAGKTINATLVITNATGKTLAAPCGLKFAVGVGNAKVPFGASFTASCSSYDSRIGPGRHSYAEVIQTNDGTMLRPTATNRYPFRPLPAGMYQTSIVFAGKTPPWMPIPPPITIRITAQ